MNDEKIPWPVKFVGGLLGTIVVVIILFAVFTTRVDAGDACAKLTFGKATGQAGPGLHFRIPGVNKYGCLSGREQTVDLVAGDPKKSDSKATHVDYQLEGRTNTGVTYTATLSLKYIVPVDNVRAIYQGVGKTDDIVYQKAVLTPLRTLTRQYLNTKSADDLYYGNLTAISNEIATTMLSPEMAKSGITLQFFGLKAFDFDDQYDAMIANKNAEIEAAKYKALQQTTATAEAERVRIEHEGTAAAVRIDAKASADAVVISAQGEAEAVALRGEAIAANPSVLDWERIQAIRDADVIYVPTDAGVIPIYPAVETRK